MLPLHITSKRCRKNLVWRGNTLCCSQCGRAAGWRWLEDGGVAIYLCREFRDMRAEIDLRPDTHRIASSADVLGEINFKEFDDFIAEVRRRNQIAEIESAPCQEDEITPDQEDERGDEDIYLPGI